MAHQTLVLPEFTEADLPDPRSYQDLFCIQIMSDGKRRVLFSNGIIWANLAPSNSAVANLGINQYGDAIYPSGVTYNKNKIAGSLDVSHAAWPGKMVEALDSTSGWSLVQTNGSIAQDTITLPDGTSIPAIKFTTDGAGAPNLLMTKSISVLYDQKTAFGMWLYVDDPGVIAVVDVLLSNETGGTFTNWKFKSFGGSGAAVFGNRLYWVAAPISAFTTGGGTPATAGSFLSMRVRVITAYQNRAGFIKCSRFMKSPLTRPKICLTFDDAYATQYTEAFRYMAKKGIKGTVAVTTSLVESNSTYCTWADLDAMYQAGWDLVAHAIVHTGFNSSSINSIAQSQTPGGAGNLTLNGSIGSNAFDAPRHVVIRAPDQGRQFTVTGTLNGVAVVEAVRAWAGSLAVPTRSLFDRVTQIATDGASTGAMTVGTSLSSDEMSAQITGARDTLKARGYLRSYREWVYPSGEFNVTSEALMSSLGMRTARVVNGQHQSPQMGDFRRYELSGEGGGGAAIDSTALIAFMTSAIDEGRNATIYLHELIQSGSPTSTQTLVSNLQGFIDQCCTNAAAGLCEFVTQSELPVS